MSEEFEAKEPETENTNANESQGSEKPEQENKTEINISPDTTKKLIYALCYLWGILFFLPLILYKNDAAATRHANEGLVLLLLSVIGNAVFGILSSLFGWLFGMLAGLYSLALLIFGIIGIVYVVTDKNEPLPIIGAIKILK